MGAMFLFTFVVFIGSSYLIYHTTTEVGDAATDYNPTVGIQVNAIMTNIVTAFQVIFLILAIGFGIGFILAIISNKNVYGGYNQGGYQP